MKHSVKTTGARVYVEPMPSADLLDGEKEILSAKAALDEANALALQAQRDESAVRKGRRLAEVPSEIRDLEDKVHHAARETAMRVRAAQVAGRRLAALLDENGDELVLRAARRKVEAHVSACDAYAVLSRSALGALGRPGLGRSPADLMPWQEPSTQARPNLADLGAYLDQTNVPAMLDEAGMTPEEAGLVLVVREVVGGVLRFLTTPARAALDDRLQVVGADAEEVA